MSSSLVQPRNEDAAGEGRAVRKKERPGNTALQSHDEQGIRVWVASMSQARRRQTPGMIVKMRVGLVDATDLARTRV